MILDGVYDLSKNQQPLKLSELPIPEPGEGEILVRVNLCGVCHTELDEIEGRTPPGKYPVVPGHQVVGRVAARGKDAGRFNEGDRVGVAWIYSACGNCEHCLSGEENLCPYFKATGRDADGGYAEYMTVPEKYAYPIPGVLSDSDASPLLCAGAIGYRSFRLTQLSEGQILGLTGFGASAHLLLIMMKRKYPGTKVFVFARNEKEREFAMSLGADWSGDTAARPPELLHAIIDTTPVWKPVVYALKHLRPGGRLVINAIRKESHDTEYLTRIKYEEHLWMEKEIKSVANVTRKDVSGFLKIAADLKIKPEIQEFNLDEANEALMELKTSKIRGAKILRIS